MDSADETLDRRVEFWRAVNAYARSCGGNPTRAVYGNTERQRVVAEIEAFVAPLFSSNSGVKQ